MLTIGFEAKRAFCNYTGLGNYARTLITNIANMYSDNKYILYTPTIKNNPRTANLFNNKSIEIVAPQGIKKIAWRSYALTLERSYNKLDIFHGLSHEIPWGAASRKPKVVVTIHDLIYKIYPKQYAYMDRLIYDQKFLYACKNSQKIIAISECTKQDIIRFFGIAESKIQVIYQSCDNSFFNICTPEQIQHVLSKYNLPKQYLLYVGSIIERKNLHRLIQALAILPATLRPPLVCIGSGNNYKKKVLELVNKHSLNNSVIFLENLPFGDFPAIYQGSIALLSPSLYEGFGIPILEAQAGGVPVITSNTSCLPEAAGQHSLLVNPTDVENIANAMEKIINSSDTRQEMGIKGKAYAQKFTANILTKQLHDLYESTVCL